MKHPKLIIDVGMHTGEDTAFYLAKGFDVVAVEADPMLIERAQARFAAEIASGRLRLYPVAIAEQRGTVRFGLTDEPGWNSMAPAVIARNESIGAQYRFVEVASIPFGEIIADVGIPYYLKIDIEGNDMLCLRSLYDFGERPTYLSIESNVSQADATAENVFDELATFWTLGYRRFKYVNQARLPGLRMPKPSREGDYVDVRFTVHSSGPFGEETPGAWSDIGQVQKRAEILRLRHQLLGFGGRFGDTLPSRVYRIAANRLGHDYWFDLHAKLTSR